VAKLYLFYLRESHAKEFTENRSDSKYDFFKYVFGQIRQKAVGFSPSHFLFLCPAKKGGLSTRRLA
jgi:hypothetical protein